MDRCWCGHGQGVHLLPVARRGRGRCMRCHFEFRLAVLAEHRFRALLPERSDRPAQTGAWDGVL